MADKIVKVKNAHLGHLSRAINSLEKELEDDQNIDPNGVSKYLESVNIKFSKVEEDSEKLLEIYTEQADIDKEVESLDTLQDKVTDVKIRAIAALDRIKEIKEDERRRRLEAERTPTPSREPKQLTPKLPELQLEKFNGELERYQEFMDSFTATIDQNPKLDPVDKFRYLRMYLEDKTVGDGPKSLIEGFSTTASNYQEALALIKETYGKKERIIMSHVSKLLNLEVKENLDKSSLRILYNKVKTHVRSLEVLDINAEQYSIFLVPIVLSKLTHNLRKEWGKSKEDDNIEALLEFIEREIRSLEDARQVESAFAPEKEFIPRKKYQTDSRNANRPSSAAALNTVTQTVKKSCIFCPETSDHYADHCRKARSLPILELKGILTKEEACWCCFRKGHRKYECRFLSKLSCEKCKRKHHTLLHENMQTVNSNSGCVASSDNKLRPIARGRLVGPTGKQLEVNVMLDPCSDESFVDKETSEFLKLEGRVVDLSVRGITGHVDKARPRKIVKAIIKHRHHLEKQKEVELVELPVIMNNLTRPAVQKQVLESKFIKNLPLADDYETPRNCNINVLIGQDYYYSVCSGKCRRAAEKPVLLDSLFGWLLLRDSDNAGGPCSNIVCMLISTQEEKQISRQLQKFWEIEEVGSVKTCQWTSRETKTFDEFKSSIEYSNKQYTVKLPRMEDDDLEVKSTNKDLALNRFLKTRRRLSKNSELERKYTTAITEYITSGYAEKVEEEVEPEDCWYIPHHIVLKEESLSTKVRLVMDGSAADTGIKSINDRLEKGPTLQPLLTSILLTFRVPKIALTSDVRKMYLMIKVDEQDRNLLRFFWQNPETKEIEVYRSCVLPFGLTCSPFLAVGIVQHHLLKYEVEYPDLVRKMIESTYMDDLLSGADTEDEAVSLYEVSSQIMKEAGMEMRKWKSNNSKMKEIFRHDGVAAESMKTITDDENEIFKLLGISYDSESDTFLFKVDDLLVKADHWKNRVTKRSILKVSPMLYDPLGWLNPFTVVVKLMIQALWERGVEWDEIVPSDIEKKWKQWIQELSSLQELKIPRRYNNSENAVDASRSELHVFGDASEVAYAAVAYLKTYDVEDNSEATLTYCKSKVAPVKKVTLPRLELMAAVLAATMSQFLKQEMKLPEIKTYLWTDSSITLHWIKGSSRQYKTYIANRIEQIHELSDPSDWRWCPGSSNPADLPSRGVTLKDLVNNDQWWKGPKWLNASPESYPKAEKLNPPPEDLLERKSVICLIQTTVKRETPVVFRLAGKLIDPMKFSKVRTLLRTTAYITRYLFNLMNKKEDRKYGPRCAPLDREDVVKSETYWLQRIQEESFPDEISKLQRNEAVCKDSKLVKLCPYYDKEDGLLKMGGRLQYSDLNETEKHPIILPYDSYLVKLIVEDIHRRQLHSGINHTLIALRDRFWVLKARKLVRRIVKSCLVCRKYSPVRIQVPMAPLPRDRITRAYPFQKCGVDFTGPIYVNTGAKVEKSYIALYTCTNIRAIHLELVQNQSTEAFLRSFRRMISRRGMISTFYSDNSLTFKSASQEMKRYQAIMNGKGFKDFLIENNIEWKFIVDYAPWWGGFYERMMKSIKTPLKKILGRAVYSPDEIYTILTEVEAMVNSRPLTQVSDEASEMNYLTPASFLIGRPLVNVPVIPVKSPDKSKRKKELNKLMVMQNRTLNQLWKMWREEYLRNLGTVPRNVADGQCIKEGELVMVAEHCIPRTKWKLGVVVKCKAGPDKRVRTVWVKIPSGIISRPVQHISRLELDSMEDFKLHSI